MPFGSLFIGRADPAPTVDSKKQGRNSALAILFKTIENVAFGSHPAGHD